MNVMARSRPQSAQRVGHRVEVTLADGRVITGSHCLMAVGAIPNTAGMGLEEAGVRLKDSGHVLTDRVDPGSPRIRGISPQPGGSPGGAATARRSLPDNKGVSYTTWRPL
ncbi:hypothetical protein ACZ90_18440 [Streptomyces albus subsp. albus]|nr:hypothetical protein ACZ90_18440 [Streptomyces albus subsp. albus]